MLFNTKQHISRSIEYYRAMYSELIISHSIGMKLTTVYLPSAHRRTSLARLATQRRLHPLLSTFMVALGEDGALGTNIFDIILSMQRWTYECEPTVNIEYFSILLVLWLQLSGGNFISSFDSSEQTVTNNFITSPHSMSRIPPDNHTRMDVSFSTK